MSMTIPHIKDMFEAGNPGYKPKFKPGAGPKNIGHTIVWCLLYAVIIWFIIQTVWS